MGWWFGRMMTFEVVADDQAPSVGAILNDASDGSISSNASDQITGFAAYGRSIKDALEPLIDCFGVELFDDGSKLRSPSSLTPQPVISGELGNSADGRQLPRMERQQRSARELPTVLRVTYYDPTREYQTGEARAVVSDVVGSESRQDLPAVVDAAGAKAIANSMIARAWSRRDRLTVRLAPHWLALQPGSRLELSAADWVVEKTTIDGFVVIAELYRSTAAAGAIISDPGRVAQNPDTIAEPLTLMLLDVPTPFASTSSDPVVLIAATSAGSWQRQRLEVSFGGQSVSINAAQGKALAGYADGVLGLGASDLLDEQNSVEITLIDQEQSLTSCDDDGLAAGQNLAVLGSELIQFGWAQALGGGRYRLSRILRCRGGTEWACSEHTAGEQFCLLKSGTIQSLPLPGWSVGAVVSATARGSTAASIGFQGESIRPPSPVKLAAELQSNGELILTWTRRSRLGFAWVDGIDAPLGEAREQYRVNLTGPAGSAEHLVGEASLTVAAAEVAALGAGALSIEVRQLGDVATSRSAQLTITLAQE